MVQIGYINIDYEMIIGTLHHDLFKKESTDKFKTGIYTVYYYEEKSKTGNNLINTVLIHYDHDSEKNDINHHFDNIHCVGYIGICKPNENHNYVRECSQNKYGIGLEHDSVLISTKRNEHIAKIFTLTEENKIYALRVQYVEGNNY